MEKTTISLKALEDFSTWLIRYGQARDHIECENCGMYLKSIFLSEDAWLREDFKNFAEGLIDYK